MRKIYIVVIAVAIALYLFSLNRIENEVSDNVGWSALFLSGIIAAFVAKATKEDIKNQLRKRNKITCHFVMIVLGLIVLSMSLFIGGINIVTIFVPFLLFALFITFLIREVEREEAIAT